MNILIADKFPKEYVEELEGLGHTVTFSPDLQKDDLVEAATDAHILIVRSTQVRQPAIDAAGNLTLIIRAGAGYDTIDVAHALYGRTMGIVGLGGIGQEVLKRAVGLGLRPVGWSRSLTPERAAELGIERCETLEELAAKTDIVTVHLARTPETQHIIGKKFFDAMKPKAIFIHAARGGIVDEAALLEAVRSKGIRAGLDVYEDEPKSGKADFANALLAEPTVYGAHHIGASTDQAQMAIAAEALRIIKVFTQTGSVPNCVNLETKSPARWQLVVRHYDKVGVLANVLGLIKKNKINVEEMENIIFAGAKAACAKIKLDSKPSEAVLKKIGANADEVIHVDLVEIA
jgi:D-3-phosphoglycerate dehydrogenase